MTSRSLSLVTIRLPCSTSRVSARSINDAVENRLAPFRGIEHARIELRTKLLAQSLDALALSNVEVALR